MSIAHKGQEAWNKGQHMPDGTGEKISKKNKGKRPKINGHVINMSGKKS